ncbi:hypothetical protein [Pollutibacter soli]|uniref:AbiU2 domain-containing protein n=1 Tax=Pollutibacter soli TaxID=3034157 RepID=UPI0030134A13
MTIKQRIESISAVFNWSKKAFEETQQILESTADSRFTLAERTFFIHYLLGFTYILIMELCKLTDAPSKKYPTSNAASIGGLLNDLEKADPPYLEFQSWKDTFDLVQSLNIYHVLRDKRDKEFAHLDGTPNSDPFVKRLFTLSEYNELQKMIALLEGLVREFEETTGEYTYPDYHSVSGINTAEFIEQFKKLKKIPLGEQ